MTGSFRLYDFEALKFLGPLESSKSAEKRKSRETKGRRDIMTNWYRAKVNPVRLSQDGVTVHDAYRKVINDWRRTVKLKGELAAGGRDE